MNKGKIFHDGNTNYNSREGSMEMIWRSDAVAQVAKARNSILRHLEKQNVAPEDVKNRVLCENIIADRDIPTHSYATMDGFALDARDKYPLQVRGDHIFPEDDPGELSHDEAVKIATGARLPDGANAVLKVEKSSLDNGELRGENIEPGTYVYKKGSNFLEGEQLFDVGERLLSKDAILLRDLGIENVPVYDRFSVGVLATGTEIHQGQKKDLDSPMLSALVKSWGHKVTNEGSVPDDYGDVEKHIARLATDHDVVLTTGGTSVGNKDYVIEALATLGEVKFHRVRIRPGKPIALAVLPEYDSIAFAIPGKPIGAYTIAGLILRPFFTGTSELPTITGTITNDVKLGPSDFEYAIPVTFSNGDVTPLGHVQSSLSVYQDTYDPSVISSSTRATRAEGFVLTNSPLSAGEKVNIVPYPVLE